MSSKRRLAHLYSVTGGLLAGAFAATPAFAASLTLPPNFPLSMRELVLAAIGILLVVLLGMMIYSRRRRVEVPSDEPDLRWWRNSSAGNAVRITPAQNPALLGSHRRQSMA